MAKTLPAHISTRYVLNSLLILLMLTLVSGASLADEKQARAGIGKLIPDAEISSIKPSAIAGLYEVVIGPQVVYVSDDGRHLVQGAIVDIETRTNLTDDRKATAKLAALDKVGEDNMIIFAPKDFTRTVTVFTDIDCPYCAKLHQEMDAYNKAGIRIRYLFFPRAGVQSPSYDKAVSVWCADDRLQAMTDSKAGKVVENKACENPIVDHMRLGQEMGVSGTPALVFDDGEVIPGYIPAARMAAYFEQKEQQAAVKK